VIAAVEHHHLRPPGKDTADRDRQQICFRAGVGEPHALQSETIAHGAGEPCLGQVGAAEVDPGIQRAVQRGADLRVRVTVDPGSVLTEKVDIFCAIQVAQPAALAARDAERERCVVQDGPRVAAWHHGCRFDEPSETLRIARDVGFLRLGERRIDVGVAQFRLAHGILRSVEASVPVRPAVRQPAALRLSDRRSTSMTTTSPEGAGRMDLKGTSGAFHFPKPGIWSHDISTLLRWDAWRVAMGAYGAAVPISLTCPASRAGS
jgi:hypothetical protein